MLMFAKLIGIGKMIVELCSVKDQLSQKIKPCLVLMY